MTRNTAIVRAIRLALTSGAAASSLCATAVLAQESADTTISTVTVTGTRIQSPNLTAISPVTAVSSDSIRVEGITRVEDLINNLPQAVADFGGNLANGATGAATVNLRGLGSQRTLVLVNGRRLMPGDPTQNGVASADINQIPAALIERIEVLTGGASAVYGADAVAGVVNFIMNDNFEGVRVDAQYSFYQHDNGSHVGDIVAARGFATPDSSVTDGYSRDLTFLMGMNSEDGRGNATVYAGYRELDPLLQAERDFSACSLTSGGTEFADITGNNSNDFICAGSSTTSPARFQAVDNDPDSETYSAEVPGTARTLNSAGQMIPYSTAAHAYNFAPLNHYQRPDKRYTAGMFAHYEVARQMDVYSEFQFMNDNTTAQIAGSGLFRFSGPGAGGNYIVNCNNPFLSPAQVDLFCTQQGLGAADDALISIGKRNTEGGGREDHLEHTSYRAVLGAKGSFAAGWNYDIYGLYGSTEFEQTFQNDISSRRSGNALLAVRDGNGNPVCRINVDDNTTNDDPQCVPYNPFQAGGVTQQALNYIQVPGLQQGSTTEQIVSGSVSGDLGQYGVKLPWARDGVGVAIGAEYRSEESETRNDVSFLTGDLLGTGGIQLNIVGEYSVSEVFAEARVPLVQDKAFAKESALELGYRYSDYSLGFSTDTYKIGADWAPVESLRLRASYQRAVRAPNIVELYKQPEIELDGNTDPCAVLEPGVGTPERSFEECARTGVSAGQYGFIASNPAAQYNGLTGGAATLDPETADTYSFGFVFLPSFLPGFNLTVDYFDIKVTDLVAPLGADLVLRNCLDTGAEQWCGLINRAPGSGSLWSPQGYVRDFNTNTGSLQTKGIDAEVNYRFDLGDRAGSLAMQLIGTWVDELLNEPATGEGKYDCAGLYGTVCLVPLPEFRTKLRTTWNTPWNLDVTLTWRHIDSVALDSSSSNPQLAGAVFVTDAELGSRDYLDLTAGYDLHTDLADFKLRLGINNVTDKDPPLVGAQSCPSVFCSGNTFPQVYDTLGRMVFMNITADF